MPARRGDSSSQAAGGVQGVPQGSAHQSPGRGACGQRGSRTPNPGALPWRCLTSQKQKGSKPGQLWDEPLCFQSRVSQRRVSSRNEKTGSLLVIHICAQTQSVKNKHNFQQAGWQLPRLCPLGIPRRGGHEYTQGQAGMSTVLSDRQANLPALQRTGWACSEFWGGAAPLQA